MAPTKTSQYTLILFFKFSPYQTVEVGEEKYCFADGNEVLIYRGYHTDWIWWDQIALGGTALLWLTLSYIVLRVVRAYYRQYK